MPMMYTNDEIVSKLTEIFKDRYDYRLINYIGQNIPIILICLKHGEFNRKTRFLFNGKGCQRCSKLIAVEKQRILITKDQATFIEEVTALNVDLDFSDTVYNGWNKLTTATCRIHGKIKIGIERLKKGLGCGRCGWDKFVNDVRKWDYDEFVNKANEIHSNKYQYPQQEINIPKIEIICSIHGNFSQRPSSHIRGSGCIHCSKSGKSNIEKIWMNSLMVPDSYRHKCMTIDNRRFKFDAYNPSSNTIYEFYGDFWHGNPDKYQSTNFNRMTKCTFGELYQKTLDREQFLQSKGYNIISIWEFEFRKGINNSIVNSFHIV